MKNKTKELRKKVVDAIGKVDNNNLLETVYEILQDEKISLTLSQIEAIEKADRQFERGEYYSEEETETYFENEIDQWRQKK